MATLLPGFETEIVYRGGVFNNQPSSVVFSANAASDLGLKSPSYASVKYSVGVHSLLL